jgi:multiple sugar transport system permease protein
LPAAILFSVFVLFPIGASINLAFYEWNGIGPRTWVGLANFRRLLADPVFQTALFNNLTWLACIGAAPLLGLGLALMLASPQAGNRMLRSLFFFPFVLSQVVIGMIFGWFFSANLGLFNAMLSWVGAGRVAPLESENWAILTVIIAGLWPQTGYCMVLYLAGLTIINPAHLEAARIDGARAWQILWHVVLPQLWPAHFIVALVCVVSAFRGFDLVLIMTRGGPYDSSMVLGLYMYEQTFAYFRYGYGAAIATILFLFMASGVAFFLRRMLSHEVR